MFQQTVSNQNTKQANRGENTKNIKVLPTQKSIPDMVAESCPKKEDGSYDVSNFNFDKAYKEIGFKRVI